MMQLASKDKGSLKQIKVNKQRIIPRHAGRRESSIGISISHQLVGTSVQSIVCTGTVHVIQGVLKKIYMKRNLRRTLICDFGYPYLVYFSSFIPKNTQNQDKRF